jgi:hypothetical protein
MNMHSLDFQVCRYLPAAEHGIDQPVLDTLELSVKQVVVVLLGTVNQEQPAAILNVYLK